MTTVAKTRLGDWLNTLSERFPRLSMDNYLEKAEKLLNKNQNEEETLKECIRRALDEMSTKEPDWTFAAASLFLESLYEKAAKNRGLKAAAEYPPFYEMVDHMTENGIYDAALIQAYSKKEIEELGAVLDKEKDKLFTYIGIVTLAERYLARDHEGNVIELPQERFMIISMALMRNEAAANRIALVKEAYWALSNLYMTVATPTLTNAGKVSGQLSSCFIDTMDDSLRGIFESNTDAATVSKNGGGLGIYLGKIRSRGSDIRGFKGNSSGCLPWMKQLNNTAVSVDQLGQRQGAIAVYQDIWNKDIIEFLDAKLNNGDERKRTHDLFTGVCIPDLFMEAVEKREMWCLFDPHEIRQVMGFSLEDSYDEKKGGGTFRRRYEQCVRNSRLSRVDISAIEIMKRIMKSQLETGTPFMFYRDTVNRMNPNKHAGMIYCSNLCTEITQNQSVTRVVSETTEDGKIIIKKEPGDFVVCNLSSISLARTVSDDCLERLIMIQVRMLDNVIDVNTLDVPQAEMTNKKYRAIGLGTFGWHHLLALKKLSWESEEAVKYADELYETINYLVIKASAALAEEKGAYPACSGSEWDTGGYFESRGYSSERWKKLKYKAAKSGMRNGYLMAVAPNASTSIIANSTPSIDPVFNKMYSEEKKNYRIPVTAPDLSPSTFWYYKSAFVIDQHWSIRQNSARQRHVDQSISFNLYVTNSIKAKELLGLHLDAWQSGLKTTYYTRSTSSELEGCESCES
ncbi:ribonucleoside-diphosphate reductase subunit alpha [Fictibacillus aquaticus]|uniref:Ribonucleoside-diphosphate reductase n=1 Tax=Fictibacillus aquaticus TaxID=2021314 RepID=A0A235F9X7_9BACL|nr:ribonucleoside-diphosphate reductase subunit alpha [Fictibacillus aquaticus]OYD57979.1 ribonucleoside-diphosphate reductase subunit alpha [Fictibacillus aquaticus]